MPDDVKSQQIEKRIDREVAGGVAVASSGGMMTIAPKNMAEIFEFAKLMSVAGDCIRTAFRNNPGACLALALQAFRWGADPFAVANKAYVTTGKAGTQIAYESQLIHAIVNSSPALARRLRSRYDGAGQQRKCIITGWVRGEDEAFEYESPTIAQIAVKNSPLWQGDPDQQLFYYATRAWARRYLPEVLLGIYTPDEVQGEIIDLTPQPGAIQEDAAATPDPWVVTDAAGEVYEFSTAEKAVEACRIILIASAANPAALATAWENNASFILSLGQDGREAEAHALERLHAELAPRIERPPVSAESEVDRPSERADAASGTGVPAAGEGIAPDTATPPADAPSMIEQRPFATTATAPSGGGGGSGDARKKDGGGPTATTAASRSEPPPDLLGGTPAEDLKVPFPRGADPAFYARQMLAMIFDAPFDVARRARIKMENEYGLKRLRAEAEGAYHEVMRALT